MRTNALASRFATGQVRTWPEERIDSPDVSGHDRSVWETVDPDGRRVVLSLERWRHIIERHQELGVDHGVMLDTVARPDRRLPGRDPTEEWYYRHGVGPSRWIRVVVHYEGDEGLIATAFPRRSVP